MFNDHGSNKSLKDILVDACKLNKNKGSSTAVLASLEEPNIMKTTNLGDSGYSIYRAKKVDGDKIVLNLTFRSEEQQYRFNFPYQCGSGCELPYKAFDNQHEVTPGKDFVVMATDGLIDNLYDKDVQACLEPAVKVSKDSAEEFELEDPESVARCMSRKAYNLSKDQRYMSPFAQGAAKVGKRYGGGKQDDITVIVTGITRKAKQ